MFHYLRVFKKPTDKRQFGVCFVLTRTMSMKISMLSYKYLLPIRGTCAFSFRETIEGNPATTQAIPSKNVEWGAATKIGASVGLATFPFTVTMNPIEKNMA